MDMIRLRTAQAAVTLVMVYGAMMKLSGDMMTMMSFGMMGMPDGFGTFVGVAELAGAVALWFRPFSALAAMGISLIMLGAIYFHVFFTPLSQAIPALIVLGCCGYIIWARRRV